MAEKFDAILVLSFGGPEGRDEVIPFLENVLRGRNVPRERMLAVAEHYYHFDGVSPINQQNRDLIAALESELDANGPKLPIYWGNRNWHPLLPDTLRKMADDGIRNAAAFFTSAFSSYSGCRQYREDIAAAQEIVGEQSPKVSKLRGFYNHPAFIETMAERTHDALVKLPEENRQAARLLFTAHSIPLSMAGNCRYEQQLREACGLVASRLERDEWKLVFQSRSGPPQQPWLEPDVCDYIESLHGRQPPVNNLVIVPIGFISDHMEVLFDLDEEAKQLCDRLDINMVRAKTAGTHPKFVRMIRDLVDERVDGRADRPVVGESGPLPDVCPLDCCLRQ